MLFQPRRDALRKVSNILAPVIDLKSKKDDDDSNSNSSFGSYSKVRNFSKVSNNTQQAMVLGLCCKSFL